MNKASERYNTKVEIPISVILETIFSDDNHDVETLCRWAKHYGFIDLIKENEKDKLGYYKLQDDYKKQSFYIWLSKEERKQYDYENYLLDEIEKKDKVLDKIKEFCNEQIKLANIEIDECCRWRNADKEKYIITETNLSKAILIKKCNKRILRVMDLVENDKYYNAKQIYEEELLEDIE